METFTWSIHTKGPYLVMSKTIWHPPNMLTGAFPGGKVVKNPPANAGDLVSIPESGRSPGGENGNSLHYSCLENPMDREAWWATVYGVTKSWT